MRMSHEEKMNANDLIFGSVLIPERDLAMDLIKMWREHEKKMEEFREKVRKDRRREELITGVLVMGGAILILFILSLFISLDFLFMVGGFVVGYVGTISILSRIG